MPEIPEIPPQYRRTLFAAAHVALICASFVMAYALRFDFAVPDDEMAIFWRTMPVLVVLRVLAFERLRLHRGYWRYTGLHDLIDLTAAVTLSSAALSVVLLVTGQLRDMSRAVLLLDWMLSIFLCGGARLLVRCVRERAQPRRAGWRRTLIVGAGEAAEMLLRQFVHHGDGGIHAVGLVDDDPARRGMWLHGVPVLGTTDELKALVARHNVEFLVIAIASATGSQMRRIVARCAETGLEFKAVPSVQELLSGRPAGDLRDVQIDDLLGRPAVKLDLKKIERDLAGRTVMVTGGAGSIGSELARQIARYRPERLILFEQAESPLYFIHLEVAQANPMVEVVPVVGDITDAQHVEEVFAAHRPDYVFHAAAYKHVPMMEANVLEAVRNNVFGTLRVAQCAARHGARKFVLISTDKAVNPTSVMGATKRIAERIALGWPSLRASRTDFRAVRFGNVLGSDGSVIPLFKRQLAAGGPLRVTHPDITRYFMTIPEAVQLVLQAAALPEAASRICMLEMGEPVKITDLAEQLIRLSGFEPHRDVQIVFTGLRPGEKLHEELTSYVEHSVSTPVEKIRVVQRDESDADGIELGIHRLAVALDRRTHEGALHEIQSLVPEYRRTPVERPVEIPAAIGDVPSVAHEVGQARHRSSGGLPVLAPVQDTVGA